MRNNPSALGACADMGFSSEWEQRFSAKRNHSHWPWSDLISHALGTARLSSDSIVLELGCAVGANVPFFQALDCQYYGLEGSKSAVATAKQKFPEWKDRFFLADFTQAFPITDSFTCIVDRSSVTHNIAADIERILGQCFNVLVPGGIYIGIDWFGDAHQAFMSAEATELDAYTRVFGEDQPQFHGVGAVHFVNEQRLKSFFSAFSILALENKIITCALTGRVTQTFNIVAQKK